MSYRAEHSQRCARAFLCTQPQPDAQRTLPHAAVITGWKPHTLPRSDAAHMRITAFTPIAYDTVDAIENALRSAGLAAQSPHALNKDALADGEYMITADGPTYDGKHVQGLSITLNRATFDKVLAPVLEHWRACARGASITP